VSINTKKLKNLGLSSLRTPFCIYIRLNFVIIAFNVLSMYSGSVIYKIMFMSDSRMSIFSFFPKQLYAFHSSIYILLPCRITFSIIGIIVSELLLTWFHRLERYAYFLLSYWFYIIKFLNFFLILPIVFLLTFTNSDISECLVF
jgi:hypothetical protein